MIVTFFNLIFSKLNFPSTATPIPKNLNIFFQDENGIENLSYTYQKDLKNYELKNILNTIETITVILSKNMTSINYLKLNGLKNKVNIIYKNKKLKIFDCYVDLQELVSISDKINTLLFENVNVTFINSDKIQRKVILNLKELCFAKNTIVNVADFKNIDTSKIEKICYNSLKTLETFEKKGVKKKDRKTCTLINLSPEKNFCLENRRSNKLYLN